MGWFVVVVLVVLVGNGVAALFEAVEPRLTDTVDKLEDKYVKWADERHAITKKRLEEGGE